MGFAVVVLDEKPPMANEPDYEKDGLLTSGQAAALLGVDPSTLRRTPYKRLPYELTPGGHRRYTLDTIAPYVGKDGTDFRYPRKDNRNG